MDFFKWAAIAAIACSASAASADTVDFTSDAWADAHGEQSFTVGYDGFDVTATASGSFNYRGYHLTQGGVGSDPNGLGVGWARDSEPEIEADEYLLLEFDGTVNINAIGIAQLYENERFWFWRYDEEGIVDITFGDSTSVGYDFTAQSQDGILALTQGWTNVSSLRFTGDSWGDDFSLSYVDVSPVPLPGAAWLFGSAILGAGVAARRRKNSVR
jgi:hypothetical protein